MGPVWWEKVEVAVPQKPGMEEEEEESASPGTGRDRSSASRTEEVVHFPSWSFLPTDEVCF